MAIDDPIALRQLLDVTDMRDMVKSFASTHRVTLSVYDTSNDLVVTTDAARLPLAASSDATTMHGMPDGALVVPLVHHGATIGHIAIDKGDGTDEQPISDRRLQELARHLSTVFEILIHNAYARHVTSALHDEAMAANFSELSAKNRRLEKAVESLQEAERLKSSFMATMSHELRTPLTSVIGYSEMLIEGLAGAVNNEQREYLKTILGKADQLLQLITSILDVSTLESGAPPLKLEPVGIRDLIDSVLTSLGDKLNERQVTVRSARPNVPRVMADARQLREVMRQLLANALKFTDKGDRIDIELGIGAMQPDTVTPHGDIGVRIVVRDSGIGISGEEQGNIFEPFFQVDSSSTRQYGGSGLGLTLAKRYVEAHGGRIWVDSKTGKGTTFTVALPAVAEDMNVYLGRARKT